MTILELILLIIAGILILIAAILATVAANNLSKVSGFSSDAKLVSARNWLVAAYVSGWIGVALVVILIIIYIVQVSRSGDHAEDLSSHWYIRGIEILIIVAALAAGIFAAVASSEVRSSGLFNSTERFNVNRDSTASAAFSLISAVIFFFIFIIALWNTGGRVGKKEAAEKDQEKGDPIIIPAVSSVSRSPPAIV